MNFKNPSTKRLFKFLRIGTFILVLSFLSSFLFNEITLPAAHDLPRQMQNGEDILKGNFDVLTKNVYSYMEPDQPFANHHWLYGVFAYILHQVVGWSGLVVFKIFFILGTFSLLFYTTLKKANFWLVALFSIPTILILISRTAFRPEIFSYFFLALFLYFLIDLEEHPEHNRIFWLIPAELVWVNTHLFFPVGVLLIGGFLLEKIVLNFKNLKQNKVVKKLTVLLISVTLITFLNPFGIGGAIFALRVNTNQDFPVASAEIKTVIDTLRTEPGWSNISAVVFLPLVTLLAVSFIAVLIYRWGRKEPLFTKNFIFYFLASVGSSLLAFFIVRAFPLFGFIFLLAISNNLNELFERIVEKFKLEWPQSQQKIIQIILILFLVITLLVLTVVNQKKYMKFSEQGVGLARYAESSANFFKDNNLRGPVFNDTDIGSYLIYYLYPEEGVFTDNRFGDAYSAEFFSEIYLPAIRDEKKWEEVADIYKFNTIFFYHYHAIDGARDFLFRRVYDTKWAWVYVDNYAVIFVRNTSENKKLIDRFRITSENLTDKLRYLSESKYENDQLAAADVFNLIGRIDLSIPIYQKIVSISPERGKIWMVLGRTELTKYDQVNSNPHIAALYLERAIEEGWKTWESYSFLALAYLRTGQLDKVKWAVKKELEIEPENLDGKKWLGIIAEEEIKQKNENQR